jgi:hypothetical protein
MTSAHSRVVQQISFLVVEVAVESTEVVAQVALRLVVLEHQQTQTVEMRQRIKVLVVVVPDGVRVQPRLVGMGLVELST